jgi:hypothetical protein
MFGFALILRAFYCMPADVYCDRRLPADVRAHEVLLGECLGGALAVNDFLRLAHQVIVLAQCREPDLQCTICRVCLQHVVGGVSLLLSFALRAHAGGVPGRGPGSQRLPAPGTPGERLGTTHFIKHVCGSYLLVCSVHTLRSVV